MRPLVLELHAIGPFAGHERIDFRALGDRRLFLVCGPIGAGKSTILDAICLALYGEPSGTERPAEWMRSHFADDSERSWVRLDFELAGRRYRIERKLPHVRPSSRSNATREPMEATLWDRDGLDPDDHREGTPLATQSRKVQEATGALLGFTVQQFRQVVILPQGEFRRFLSGKSDEREEVLKVLFGTRRHEQFQEELRRRAEALQRDIESTREACRASLASVGEATPEGLAQRIAAATERDRLAREAIDRARATEQAAQSRLAEARMVEALFVRRDDAERERARLAEEAPAQEARTARISAARRAAQLADVRRLAADRRAQSDAAEARRAAAHRDRLAAGETLRSARAALDAEHARAPERDRLAAEEGRLRSIAPMVERLAALEAEAARAAAAAAVAERELAKARAAHEAAAAAHAQALADADSTRRAADGLAAAELRAKEARRRRALAADLAAAESGLAAALAQAQACAAARDAAAREAHEADAEHERLLALWNAGQAALLAESLRPGHACPVCGSTEHPAPAHGIAPPKSKAMNDASIRAKRAAAALASAREAHAGAAAAVTAAEQRRARLLEEAAPIAAEPADADAAEAAVASARAAAERLPLLQSALAKREAAVASAQAAAAAAQDAHHKAAAESARAAGALAEMRASLPPGVAGAGAFRTLLERTAERRAALDAALEKARAAAEAAASAEAAAVARAESAAASATAARAASDTAAAELAARREAAGFTDDAALAQAERDLAAIDRLEAEARAYEESLSAAVALARQAHADVAGRERPDLAAIAQRAAEASAARDAAEAALRTVAQERARLDAVAHELESRTRHLAEAEEAAGRVMRLSDLANGKGAGDARGLTFHRYVLGHHLAEVLEAANARLAAMTLNRYELRVAQGRQATRRVNWGLDIEVMDAHTGEPRAVGTLSGGEGFLASLALALGLADTVQSESAARPLDTIFIDEGFGSLDGGALERAMDALRSLQATGRLVGVVSHVAEMREEIDAVLEVTNDGRGRGSRTRLVLR